LADFLYCFLFEGEYILQNFLRLLEQGDTKNCFKFYLKYIFCFKKSISFQVIFIELLPYFTIIILNAAIVIQVTKCEPTYNNIPTFHLSLSLSLFIRLPLSLSSSFVETKTFQTVKASRFRRGFARSAAQVRNRKRKSFHFRGRSYLIMN